MTSERVIEVAIGLYGGPRTGADAPRSMAKAVLDALAEHGLAVIPQAEHEWHRVLAEEFRAHIGVLEDRVLAGEATAEELAEYAQLCAIHARALPIDDKENCTHA